MTEVPFRGRRLFAYGTLMFPAVIKSVIGRVPDSHSAVISGYRRLEVAGESFPGLVTENGGSVEGLLYENISSNEWERLASFEDDFYELQQIIVDCSGTNVGALAFIVPPSRRSVLSGKVWNPEFFQENHLAEFARQRQSSTQQDGRDRDGCA
ncbi:MAG TPA: gamma-glutamylcyclotransferase family protein [Terrimicrobiaceae bacterium]